MKTFKLWFEPHEDIPKFKKLCWDVIDVSLSDVLKKGIHPWQGGDKHRTLGEKFVQALNKPENKPAGLIEFNYCGDISSSVNSYYYARQSHFEEILQRIQKHVFFVDKLSYMELLDIAKQKLRDKWSHDVAYQFLMRIYNGFDPIRRFLKEKDKKIKLSGYEDIRGYDLGKILSLDDFAGEDSVIISEVIGTSSFRSSDFISQVTDRKGRIKLTDSIRHFQITLYGDPVIGSGSVLYNCQRAGDIIRFWPEIGTQPRVRDLAKNLAKKWRSGKEKYCFDLSLKEVESIIVQGNCTLDFSALSYLHKTDGKISFGKLEYSDIKGYSVGRIPSLNSCNETVKEFLKNHGMSMTGRKEELLDKLASLSVEVYKEHESILDDYFKGQRFMKVVSLPKGSDREFPLLRDLDLRNMILTMYIIKHLRGNVILEASHNNETYDLLSLAQALIKGEVCLSGCFLRVG